MKVQCYNCGYEWDCKSLMIYVNCPSCRKMVQIREEPEQPKQ